MDDLKTLRIDKDLYESIIPRMDKIGQDVTLKSFAERAIREKLEREEKAAAELKKLQKAG